MIKQYELKTCLTYFQAIWDGKKTFEIRKDDRGGFTTGDLLSLREWNPVKEEYTGRAIDVNVIYVAHGLGLWDGYVGMSIEVLTRFEAGSWQPL